MKSATTPGLPASLNAAPPSEDRDLAHEVLGQTSMALAFQKLARVTSLVKLHQVKERKLYRALAGKPIADQVGKSGDASPLLKGTWDGYCQLLGLSREKVDEDLRNLAAFGEEALQGLTRVGAGYRQLRKLRQLPDDDRSALIKIAASEDREALLEMVEDLSARNETLVAQNAEAQETLVARQRLLDGAETAKNRLKEQLARPYKASAESTAKTAEEQVKLDELAAACNALDLATRRLAVVVREVLSESPTTVMATAARTSVECVFQRIAAIASEHHMPVQFEHLVCAPWLKLDALPEVAPKK